MFQLCCWWRFCFLVYRCYFCRYVVHCLSSWWWREQWSFLRACQLWWSCFFCCVRNLRSLVLFLAETCCCWILGHWIPVVLMAWNLKILNGNTVFVVSIHDISIRFFVKQSISCYFRVLSTIINNRLRVSFVVVWHLFSVRLNIFKHFLRQTNVFLFNFNFSLHNLLLFFQHLLFFFPQLSHLRHK